MEPTEINAGSLHLRPWAGSDAGAVLVGCADPLTQRWTSVPSPYTLVHAQAYVAAAPAGWAAGTALSWAVRDSTTGAVLANLALRPTAAPAHWAVGFWALPAARGRGVVTQALGAVSRWAFGALDAQELSWTAQVGNVASRRVAQKAGFTVEEAPRGTVAHHGLALPAWQGARRAGEPERDTGPVR